MSAVPGTLRGVFATSGRARPAYESTGDEGGADVLLLHAGFVDEPA